jgi:hypothetical protein
LALEASLGFSETTGYATSYLGNYFTGSTSFGCYLTSYFGATCYTSFFGSGNTTFFSSTF